VHLECDVLLLQDNIVGSAAAGDGAHGPHLIALLDTLAVGALVATHEQTHRTDREEETEKRSRFEVRTTERVRHERE